MFLVTMIIYICQLINVYSSLCGILQQTIPYTRIGIPLRYIPTGDGYVRAPGQ
jgi:hypothetical protein